MLFRSISQVFTGAIYDILADIFAFEKALQASTKDPARVLLEVSSRLCKLVVDAIVAAPASAATYSDIANKMLNISNAQGDPPIYRTFIRNRVTVREVVVSPTPLTAMMEGRIDLTNPNFTDGADLLQMEACKYPSDKAPQDRSRCCGTMQLPEHCTGDSKTMLHGGAYSQEDALAGEVADLRKAFK